MILLIDEKMTIEPELPITDKAFTKIKHNYQPSSEIPRVKSSSPKFSLYSLFSETPTLVPVLFFNFSYYVAFCPFKFVKNEKNEYLLGQWFPQKVICAFVSITSIIHRITETRVAWPGPSSSSQGNPVTYFNFFHNLANMTFNVIVWYEVWFYGEKLLELLKFLHAKEHRPDGKLRARAVISGSMICFTATFVALLCFIFGTDLLIESQWNPELLFKCFSRHAKYAMFITDESMSITEKCSHESESKDLTLGEVFLACLFGASYMFRRIVGIYENILTAVGPFTLWISTKEFIKSLPSESDTDGSCSEGWEAVAKRYNFLRQFADFINDLFGPLVVAHLFTAFFFYSVNLDKFITAKDTLIRLKFLVYYVIFASTLIIASDICRQMSKMEPWIAKNINGKILHDLNHRELAVILHEIQENRISVIGCGLFTLTYSLSAQVTGAIVTYFIISVQYHRFDPETPKI